jgi:glutamate synthase domain-containing protein 2/glutamate synthase domain-containing protein 1/glutamate synthase domain-containing protein 3
MTPTGLPPKQGLYDPDFEHDSCGAGFVVNMKGKKSHEIISQALTILRNLAHRGACGSEANSGDGAGILLQVPHTFLAREMAGVGVTLPEAGGYGAGTAFLPNNPAARVACEEILEATVAEEGQRFLGWRDVPTDHATLGETAIAAQPVIRQFFVGRGENITDDQHFERKLCVIRKRAAHTVRQEGYGGSDKFYVPSLSARTLVYKGMLMPEQVAEFYPDLADPDMESALALVHSRFSTNTFPSWERAHPYRMIAHNGEINTLRGNVNWLRARQAQFASALFGEDLPKMLPILNDQQSDSAIFDNCLEFLTLAGRSLPHAVMMMIPEPWANHESMSPEKKAFYQYHSCLMEPWDGPASIGFTDGIQIGAVLDRNGLRPSRYYVTKDDLVIMASEVGVLDIAPERILSKGRLQPGRMFLVDTAQGRIVADEEIKEGIARENPYRAWLNDNLIKLSDLPVPKDVPTTTHETVLQRQQAFGYTFEDLRILMAPMARNGIEAIGSMGTDTPLAVLSDKPQSLFNYFQQLFAQVTNPPIDCIREEIVTSSAMTIGTERNLLDPKPENCHLIALDSPILTNDDLAKLRQIDRPGFNSIDLPIVFKASEGAEGLERAMEALFAQADAAIAGGKNILILSDRTIDHDHAPIPALLASAGLHHHLIRQGTRTRIGLVLESGEPREVHHFSLLVGYGVAAINPYLAFETIDDAIREDLLRDITPYDAKKNYVKAVVKGIVKVISKMGISTVESYCGAQIFEAIGLHESVIGRYFTRTASRIGGVGMDVLAREATIRHAHAFPDRGTYPHTLDVGGQYQWRADGEYHLFSPQTVHKLQQAVRTGNYAVFKEYSSLVNEQLEKRATLRGLLGLKLANEPIPLDEVEPWTEIVKRFKTGAMSYGSISREAHESLAIAMNRIGGKSNTGEGGEDPARYIPDANGDSRNSAIKQVASGRFGVTSHYLVNAQELQIKMAQGAKPGEGGQLPGPKVYPWIAKVRFSTPGVGLISPPPHHDIYSIEDLAELIHDLKNANTQARISVKLVAEVGVGTIAAGVAKAKADVVLISGHDGGTGASPQTSIKHAGIPWELGLAETHQTLVLNNLRSRIAVETDGQLKTGRDVVIAALLGAEEFGFATAPLVSLGCIMMRVCHLNTCPVGVATQDPDLRKNFTGDPAHAVNFMRFIAEEVREIMAQMGFRTLPEMIGHTERLEAGRAVDHWKTRGLDFSHLFYQPEVGPEVGLYKQMAQDHGLDGALDNTTLLALCAPALERGERVEATLPIKNVNRVVGTIVGSEVTRRWGEQGLPEDTIKLNFHGSAGQSFGAFIPAGMTLLLSGDANDYLGKGLSGGKIVITPPPGSTFVPRENIIIGNTALYGATSGEVYIRGGAGERFAVRNSGANAVVEAVGDHGCEYMTGGRVIILGPTGRNFAAGMSGGIAYVLDKDGDFASRCNKQMVGLEKLEDLAEIEEVRQMIRRYVEATGADQAAALLDRWEETVPRFVKVIPHDYKRMLEAIARVEASGLSGEEALLAAFEDNAHNTARAGGS